MEYMNVVRSDFEEFAKENVESYEHSKTLMKPERVSNKDYPQLEYVPFFFHLKVVSYCLLIINWKKIG